MRRHRPPRLARWGASVALVLSLVTVPAHATEPEPPSAAAPELQAAFDQAWQVLLAGNYEQGLPQIEAVLQRSRQALGPSHAFTLKTQDYLGGTLLRMGRLAAARQTFEETLAWHRRAGTQESLAALSSLNNLAKTIEQLESAQAALPWYAQAMVLRERLVGADHLESVTVLDDHASALGEAGHWHAALPLLTQALRLRTEGLGASHPWTLTSQNNLAHLLSRLGRYPEALALNEQVLQARLASPGEQHPSTWVSMSNTAVSLLHLGRHEEALTLQRRALALRLARWPAKHPSVISNRRGLAQTLRAMGRLDEAETELRQLLNDSTEAFGASHQQAQLTRLALAELLIESRRWAAALALLETTETIYLDTAGPHHFSSLQAGVMRADVACRLGQSPAAQVDLAQLAARIEVHQEHDAPLLQQARRSWASCELMQGSAAHAEELLSQVVADDTPSDAELSLWADPRSDDSRGQAQARRLQVLALARLGRLVPAFATLEQAKSRQLVAQLSERAAAQAAGVPVAQQALMQAAQERLFAAKSALRELNRLELRPAHVGNLQAAAQALQALRAGWEQQHASFRRITRLPEVIAPTDGRLLPRRALLVSYLLTDLQNLGAFSLDASGRLDWHELGAQPHLAAHVEAFRLASSQSGNRVLLDDAQAPVTIQYWREGQQDRWQVLPRDAMPCPRATGEAFVNRRCVPVGARTATATDLARLQAHLSHALLGPMKAKHPRDFHRQWVISPDGPLGALPWDLLTWRGQLVAAQVTVSQLQSMSVLKAQQALRSPQGQPRPERDLALLALGNPNFSPPGAIGHATDGSRQGPAPRPETPLTAAGPAGWPVPATGLAEWPALPASALEIRLAAAAFPGQDTLQLTGPQASKARLLQASASGELARARHVLLATHVWYHPERPQDSRLVLSSPPPLGLIGNHPPDTAPAPSPGPELLSPPEIMGLRLQSDLTVLAACNSARGDSAPDGRSQLGFAYALQVAGNRNAVLALWPVRDLSTAQFTARFFQHVARGERHAAALAATKREFMVHAHRPWRAPQHWAGFVLVGV